MGQHSFAPVHRRVKHVSLLKVSKYQVAVVPAANLTRYLAWLEYVKDQVLRRTMLAANVNIMRRISPYCYLVVSGMTERQWRAEDLGDSDQYVEALAVREMQRGAWSSKPPYESQSMVVVIAILCGDVLPIVHLLESDEYSLLCLPSPVALDDLEPAFVKARSYDEELGALLSTGGCLLTITDEVAFKVVTGNKAYSRYFAV